MKCLDQTIGDNFALYHGDCVEVLKGLPARSMHYSIFSPPFASLYTYSNSPRDMGNCRSNEEFFEHFGFLVDELARVMQPGCCASARCPTAPSSPTCTGSSGLDTRGLVLGRGATLQDQGAVRLLLLGGGRLRRGSRGAGPPPGRSGATGCMGSGGHRAGNPWSRRVTAGASRHRDAH